MAYKGDDLAGIGVPFDQRFSLGAQLNVLLLQRTVRALVDGPLPTLGSLLFPVEPVIQFLLELAVPVTL